MKNLTIIFFFTTLLPVSAQTYFVETTEKKFESKIIDKMKYEGYKLSDNKDDSDYTIQCLLDGQYKALKIGAMFHGYVKIIDSKTGDELARTKEVGKSPSIYNGMQAGPQIMSVIANKYLLPILNNLKSNFKTQSK